jgi:hypothetical protein
MMLVCRRSFWTLRSLMKLGIQILNSPAVKGTFCFCVSVAEPRRCFLGVCAPTQQPTAGDNVIKKLSAMQLNILAHQAVEVFNPLWSRGLSEEGVETG